jgi:hypothetical protein
MKNTIKPRYKKNESDDDSKPEKISSRNTENVSDDDDGSDWSNEEEQNDQNGSDDEDGEIEATKEIEVDENIPLYQLLQQHSEKLQKPTVQSKQLKRLSKRDHDTLELASPEDDEEADDDHNSSGKKSKNAPTEMRSDRPVKRLRMTSEMQINKRKFIDPRFVDYSGDLSQKHFAKNFEFIEEMKENELYLLRKKHKKVKDETNRQEIKHEINT